MSLSTINDLRRHLRTLEGSFGIGSTVRDQLSETDAQAFLDDAYDELRNYYGENIELIGNDSWVFRTLVRLECYLVYRMLFITYNFDTAKLDSVNSEIRRLRELIEKRPQATSVKMGAHRP